MRREVRCVCAYLGADGTPNRCLPRGMCRVGRVAAGLPRFEQIRAIELIVVESCCDLGRQAKARARVATSQIRMQRREDHVARRQSLQRRVDTPCKRVARKRVAVVAHATVGVNALRNVTHEARGEGKREGTCTAQRVSQLQREPATHALCLHDNRFHLARWQRSKARLSDEMVEEWRERWSGEESKRRHLNSNGGRRSDTAAMDYEGSVDRRDSYCNARRNDYQVPTCERVPLPR